MVICVQIVTKNAHKIADVITRNPEALATLTAKDCFHIASGFGYLYFTISLMNACIVT